MALDFIAYNAEKASKIKAPKGVVITDEFVAEYSEAMQHILNSGHDGLTVHFADHKTREKWFNTAVAYGATLAVPMSIRRIKGTDSMNKEHGSLTFTLETTAGKEERQEEGRKAKMRAEILKSYGHSLRAGRGGKTEEDKVREEATLKKFYGMTEEQQEAHLVKYRASVKSDPHA